jgi:hypothetical protein
MEDTPSKGDGYALPEKDDPWALGEGRQLRDFRPGSLRRGKSRPSAHTRVRKRPGR